MESRHEPDDHCGIVTHKRLEKEVSAFQLSGTPFANHISGSTIYINCCISADACEKKVDDANVTYHLYA